MPFGVIFAALVLGFLGPWFGVRFLGIPWGPVRATGALLVVYVALNMIQHCKAELAKRGSAR